MKKLLVIISLFFIPNYALAATYYVGDNNYYYDDTYSASVVGEETRYKFYTENKVYSNKYYFEAENDKEYNIKSDKFILLNPSEYSKIYPENKPNRVISSKKIYKYGSLEKIRYIKLYDIMGSNNNLRFYELNIFNNNEQINYLVECDTCSEKFKKNINNDIFDEDYVTANDSVVIDLEDYYSINNLKISIYLTDPVGNSNSTIKLKVSKDNIEYLDYINPSIDVNMNNNYSNYYIYDINLKDYITKEVYVDVFESEEKNDQYILIDSYDMYSYQDKMYLYYKIEKSYLTDYYVDKEGYIKDETLSKIFYKKQNKFKVNIDDNFIINSYEYDIKNIISSSEIDINKFIISDKIDINENGVYTVLLKYGDFEIEKYVTVDIKRLDDEVVENKNNNVKQISLVSQNKKSNDNKSKIYHNKTDQSKVEVNKVKLSYIPVSVLLLFTIFSLIRYKNCRKLLVKDID